MRKKAGNISTKVLGCCTQEGLDKHTGKKKITFEGPGAEVALS